MKTKNEWVDIIYRDRMEEDKIYLHVDRMLMEFKQKHIGAIKIVREAGGEATNIFERSTERGLDMAIEAIKNV